MLVRYRGLYARTHPWGDYLARLFQGGSFLHPIQSLVAANSVSGLGSKSLPLITDWLGVQVPLGLVAKTKSPATERGLVSDLLRELNPDSKQPRGRASPAHLGPIERLGG